MSIASAMAQTWRPHSMLESTWTWIVRTITIIIITIIIIIITMTTITLGIMAVPRPPVYMTEL